MALVTLHSRAGYVEQGRARQSKVEQIRKFQFEAKEACSGTEEEGERDEEGVGHASNHAGWDTTKTRDPGKRTRLGQLFCSRSSMQYLRKMSYYANCQHRLLCKFSAVCRLCVHVGRLYVGVASMVLNGGVTQQSGSKISVAFNWPSSDKRDGETEFISL